MCQGCMNSSRQDRYFYDSEFEPEYECRECDEKDRKIYDAKDYLVSIVHKLYSKDTLDVYELENDLDELCHALGVKLLPGELQIQRKSEKKEEIVQLFKPIEEWKEFNNYYLKQLTQ